jgi:quercetin dioxygenase-like cupin family protein
MSQRVVEDPVLRQRLSFQRTADEDGGEVLRIEIWVDPGGGVPPHIHPAMEERFEVLAGRPSFLAGRKWQTAVPGETVVVPAGVRHAYRNRGDETAHVVCEARPPSTLQEFLEDAAALGRAGKLTRNALPKSPGALLQAAVMAQHHRDMVVLLFPPMPPPRLQRLIFPALARLGERRGHKPGRIAETG